MRTTSVKKKTVNISRIKFSLSLPWIVKMVIGLHILKPYVNSYCYKINILYDTKDTKKLDHFEFLYNINKIQWIPL